MVTGDIKLSGGGPYFIQSCNSTIYTPILLVCVLPVVVRLSSDLTFLIILVFVGWFIAVAIRVGISSLLFVTENDKSIKKRSDAGCRSAAQIACRSKVGCGIKHKVYFGTYRTTLFEPILSSLCSEKVVTLPFVLRVKLGTVSSVSSPACASVECSSFCGALV